MPALQTLLFPDPRPLVERLGRDFFRRLPESPGVYLMRDAEETVLYVGKAINLRRRLASYRVANPDRMPRRRLRLLRAVARIELEPCPDESAALARESELLRSLRPKFNRAGVWPAPTRHFVWRRDGDLLHMAVAESPENGWRASGVMGAGARRFKTAAARLLWFAFHPQAGVSGLPAGWLGGIPGIRVVTLRHPEIETVDNLMERYFAGEPESFIAWLQAEIGADAHPVELAIRAADLESLAEFARKAPRKT
jgi:predicted GIY-YIG superfamily endonuclease